MDKDFLNRDGQPPSGINAKKVMARQQAELSGILKGVACDKVITPSEAKFVYEWLNLHKQVDDGITYTGLIDALDLLERTTRGTFDDPQKLQSILRITQDLVNGGNREPSAADLTMEAADNIPADEIVFKGQHFCFTGKLRFGPRSKAVEFTEARLGITTDSVTYKLNYLVCGDLGSRDWSQSSFGEKIRKALYLKKSGANLWIIDESIWLKALEMEA